MRHNVLYLLSQLIICALASAQDTYDYEMIGLEHGLSQSSINAITQDKKGFLWLGTQDGLNRFDGRNFTVYKKDPFDTSSLSENFISALQVDTAGRLWIGTYHGGLNLYDPQLDVFYRYIHDPTDPQSLSDNNITCMEEDSQGRIWVGTSNGFNLLHFRAKNSKPQVTFSRYQTVKGKDRENNRQHIILSLLCDKDGNIWAGTYNGLYFFTPENSFKAPAASFFSRKKDLTTLSSSFIRGLLQDKLGRIWVATNNGLNVFNPEKQTFQRFFMKNPGAQSTGVGYYITGQLLTRDGNILIATHKDLYQIPFIKGAYASDFSVIEGKEKEKYGELPLREVSVIFEDKLHDGLFWIGTNLSGLGKMKKKPRSFNRLTLRKDDGTSPGSNSVRYITQDSFGNTWIGVYGGLYIQNTQKGIYRYIYEVPVSGYKMSTEAFFKVFRDSEGTLWAGTYQGLVRLRYDANGNLEGQAFWDQYKCDDRAVFDIYEERDKLYLATYSGLNVFDKKTQRLYPCSVELDSASNQQFNYRVHKVLRDNKNRVWIGTTCGLILFRNVNGTLEERLDGPVEIYYYHENNKQGLMSNYINDIHQSSSGDIWVGTMQGLERVVDGGKRIHFDHFTEKNGLSNNVVYGILEDSDSSKLWLSTNNGLSCFDPVSESFTIYKHQDGLPSNEFNANAFYKSPEGEMYFGGVNGLSHFFPQDISHEDMAPPVWLTSLTTNHYKEINLLGVPGSKRVELPYKNNSFSVRFVGLDYTAPGELEYYYDLVGAGQNNLPLGNNTQLYISNLAPGEYTLRVRSASRDGLVSPHTDEVAIAVLSPFWMKTWFYLLLIVLLIGFTWLFYYALYRFKMNRIEAIERFRKQAAQDFHDELGSKLTIISMYSELTRNQLNGAGQKVNNYLDKVINTSGTLYDSMKDLIWSLNPERDSLKDLYLQLKDFGEDLFVHSDVEFSAVGFDSPLADQELDMDVKRHVLLIFKELMNNIIKHAEASHVSFEMKTRGQQLIICLIDDGTGFDMKEALQQDGFGLKNTRSRAEGIGANLEIQSSESGTRVCLTSRVKKSFGLLKT